MEIFWREGEINASVNSELVEAGFSENGNAERLLREYLVAPAVS